MKISLQAAYKSLHSFESDELNDFTIITGKNGSGKSQLLSRFDPDAYFVYLQQKNIQTVLSDNFNNSNKLIINSSTPVKRIQIEGITKERSIQVGYDAWKQIINNIIQVYRQLTPAQKKLMQFSVDHNIKLDDVKKINNSRNSLLFNTKEYVDILLEVLSTTELQHLKNNLEIGEKRALEIVLNPNLLKAFTITSEISKSINKSVEVLSELDYYNHSIKEHHIDNSNLFYSQIEFIFYNYAKRRDLNRRNFFYKKEEGDENDSVSTEEFENKFIPPWRTLNSVLQENNLDFYFDGIEKQRFSTDVPIDFLLTKKSTNDKISFSDLSSGEKVIFGLILKLFTSEYYGENLSFPDLLILDEPDAHLHPEMSKLLLDVLGETFVKRFGIKVIITTHSPSTIALADESCIYQLTNGIHTSLKKISKDAGLKILTGFIPTLSIDYKNHRQVFVESPTDVTYYQYLHDKHRQVISLPHRLYFISNAMGKGNCELVYRIVEQLRGSGSNTTYGIVDWDLKNKPNEFVYVNGLNERYNIESFVLEPIYVICLLIDTNNAHNIMSGIGIDKTYNQYSLGNESPERIQFIIRHYFSLFEIKFPYLKYESERIVVEYLNGKTSEIPKWYLQMQGHDLVAKVKEVFPALKTKYSDEGTVQVALATIMAKFYPFVPLAAVKTIENLSGKNS